MLWLEPIREVEDNISGAVVFSFDLEGKKNRRTGRITNKRENEPGQTTTPF